LLCGNQHHCVDNFTFESTFLQSCLPLEESAQEPLLAEDLACDYIALFPPQLGVGKLGNDTIVSGENQDADGHPCSLLSAGKPQNMGTKQFLLRSQSQ